MRIVLYLSILVFTLQNCKHDQSVIRMNHIQILGSHNSYKEKMDSILWETIYIQDSLQALGLDYGHIPLADQLDMGICALELDVFHDPEGGRYSAPQGLFFALNTGFYPKAFDGEVMQGPGMKVLHIQDIDFRSSCPTFKDCLNQVNQWSKDHPSHLPIIITLNAKDEKIDLENSVVPLKFNSHALDKIDQEIRSVFKEDQLITPYKVRGEAATLEEAVLTRGWPILEESRGKFLFVLDENGEKLSNYIKGHPSLAGRVMFVNAPFGTPEAAFLIINKPDKDFVKIHELVKKGYFARTRADAGTWEARRNDKSRFEKALASGAQVISTDYYLPDSSLGTDYQIQLPGGKVAICNPLFEIVGCEIVE